MTDITREAVERLAQERDERAAESLMMADAHRAGGHHAVADGWQLAADQALSIAATLRAQQAEIAAMRARDDTFARLLRQARAEGMRMAAQVAVDFDGGAETDPGGWPGRIAAAILAAAEQEEQEEQEK